MGIPLTLTGVSYIMALLIGVVVAGMHGLRGNSTGRPLQTEDQLWSFHHVLQLPKSVFVYGHYIP